MGGETALETVRMAKSHSHMHLHIHRGDQCKICTFVKLKKKRPGLEDFQPHLQQVSYRATQDVYKKGVEEEERGGNGKVFFSMCHSSWVVVEAAAAGGKFARKSLDIHNTKMKDVAAAVVIVLLQW